MDIHFVLIPRLINEGCISEESMSFKNGNYVISADPKSAPWGYYMNLSVLMYNQNFYLTSFRAFFVDSG